MQRQVQARPGKGRQGQTRHGNARQVQEVLARHGTPKECQEWHEKAGPSLARQR